MSGHAEEFSPGLSLFLMEGLSLKPFFFWKEGGGLAMGESPLKTCIMILYKSDVGMIKKTEKVKYMHTYLIFLTPY